MADAYWKYTTNASQPPQLPSALASLTRKRDRHEYELAGSQDLSAYYAAAGDRGTALGVRDIETQYDNYVHRLQIPYYGAGQSTISMSGGFVNHPIEDPRLAGIRSFDANAIAQDQSASLGSGMSVMALPADASSTLFVEGLPADCTSREVAHIFRPFVGYKEVRLVSKESRYPGGDPLVFCFVDFSSPAHAFTAMNALQGYQLDEVDRSSAILRLQFARNPGARSGGGRHGRR